MSSMERGRNWSGGLPSHLLGSVFSRLPLPDYLRSRAVCRDWCLSADNETPHGPTVNPRSPWLMLPPRDDENKNEDYCLRQFYSVPERRTYKIRIPHLHGIRCLGSSDGWLVLLDDMYELQLLNPITGASLRLPSISTFSNVTLVTLNRADSGYLFENADGSKNFYSFGHMTYSYYAKVVVFKSLVFVIHGLYSRLAYASPGDKSWNELGSRYVNFADIALHKGNLYGVHADGRVVIIGDIASPLPSPEVLPSPQYPAGDRNSLHLMESADGKNLLLVSRRQTFFSVFRLEWPEWVPVANLGDCAIFVGGNRSLALSKRDLPEVRGNCIYFTKFRKYCIYSRNCWSTEKAVCRDAGVFHLRDENITPCYSGQFLLKSRDGCSCDRRQWPHKIHSYRRVWSEYLWFMPSLS